MIDLTIAFAVGVTVATVGLLPAAAALVYVVRYSLRVASGLREERDEWQTAAANAAVAARLAEGKSAEADDYTGG